jgi:protein SCO1/2
MRAASRRCDPTLLNRTTAATFLVFALVVSNCGQASAQTVLPKILQNVGFDQRLNEQVPLALPFTDEEGRRVTLGEYFRDKPVILVLAYYRCPMLCTQVLNGLVQGLRDIPFTIGKEFRVVTVSFDPHETTEMAAAKKRTYVHSYGKPESAEGWHFLTGDEHSIERLTRAVGFRYAYDPASEQFAHAAGIVILTPTGKISRYFYDVHYSGRDLRLGLVEASKNKIGSPIDQILLFCFHYDPTAGKYGAAIMNFVRAGGVLTVVGLGLMFGLLMRSDHERRRLTTLGNSANVPSHAEPMEPSSE